MIFIQLASFFSHKTMFQKFFMLFLFLLINHALKCIITLVTNLKIIYNVIFQLILSFYLLNYLYLMFLETFSIFLHCPIDTQGQILAQSFYNFLYHFNCFSIRFFMAIMIVELGIMVFQSSLICLFCSVMDSKYVIAFLKLTLKQCLDSNDFFNILQNSFWRWYTAI